ncbi:MAG: hypothetical protein ACMXX5_00390 [Candidatus Woesearchaeota archaeon]
MKQNKAILALASLLTANGLAETNIAAQNDLEDRISQEQSSSQSQPSSSNDFVRRETEQGERLCYLGPEELVLTIPAKAGDSNAEQLLSRYIGFMRNYGFSWNEDRWESFMLPEQDFYWEHDKIIREISDYVTFEFFLSTDNPGLQGEGSFESTSRNMTRLYPVVLNNTRESVLYPSQEELLLTVPVRQLNRNAARLFVDYIRFMRQAYEFNGQSWESHTPAKEEFFQEREEHLLTIRNYILGESPNAFRELMERETLIPEFHDTQQRVRN